MSANNKGELKFLERKLVKDKVYRPSEDIVNGSIHVVSVSTQSTGSLIYIIEIDDFCMNYNSSIVQIHFL